MITLLTIITLGLVGLFIAIILGLVLLAGTAAAVPLLISGIIDAIIIIKIIKKAANSVSKIKTKKKKK